jgi:hypothetical protein
MKKPFFLFLLFITSCLIARGQKPFELGAEYIGMFGKGYSTTKAGVRGETFSGKSSFSAGITYQFASGKSYSVSSGFGFYAGYRYAFKNDITASSLIAGARILFSFEDFEGKNRESSILITPMGELGYHLLLGKSFYAAPAAGFGYTIEMARGYNSLDEDRGGRLIPMVSAGFRF